MSKEIIESTMSVLKLMEDAKKKDRPLDPSFGSGAAKKEDKEATEAMVKAVKAAKDAAKYTTLGKYYSSLPPMYNPSSTTLSSGTLGETIVDRGGDIPYAGAIIESALRLGRDTSAGMVYTCSKELSKREAYTFVTFNMVMAVVSHYFNGSYEFVEPLKADAVPTADEVMDMLPADLFMTTDKETLRSIVETIIEIMEKKT